MNLWLIIAVTHTTLAVVKLKPEKNSGLNGIRTHDLCVTGAVLYRLSRAIKPSGSGSCCGFVIYPYNFFQALNFTTAKVVCITAMIDRKFILSSALLRLSVPNNILASSSHSKRLRFFSFLSQRPLLAFPEITFTCHCRNEILDARVSPCGWDLFHPQFVGLTLNC